MADDPPDVASPVCYLPEAEAAYAGYLTPVELAGLLQRWMRMADDPQIAAALAALMTETPPVDIAALPSKPVAPDLLRAEMAAALPKIRDDHLHRKLQAVILGF